MNPNHINNSKSTPKSGFNTLETAFEKWENNYTKKEESKMTNQENTTNSSLMTVGKIAAVVAGGYLLWINRFRVQRVLEANGIKTPWMKNTVGEAVQSGAAKILGSTEHEFKAS